jgi:hypothetical protein
MNVDNVLSTYPKGRSQIGDLSETYHFVNANEHDEETFKDLPNNLETPYGYLYFDAKPNDDDLLQIYKIYEKTFNIGISETKDGNLVFFLFLQKSKI